MALLLVITNILTRFAVGYRVATFLTFLKIFGFCVKISLFMLHEESKIKDPFLMQ